jgi:hypothetical protein
MRGVGADLRRKAPDEGAKRKVRAMSLRAITAARKIKTGSPSNKAVFNCLADHANDADQCWPSISTMANETELSPDTVRRSLVHLSRRLITRSPRYQNGGRISDLITLHLPASCEDAPSTTQVPPVAPCQDPSGNVRGVSSHQGGDKEASRKLQRSEREEPQSIEIKFDELMRAYPRRDGSNPLKPARDKFFAKVRRGADADAIITAAKAYAAECDRQKKTGTEFVKQAQFWLSQESWRDNEILPPAPPSHPLATLVKVFTETPQWEAWVKHWRATRGGVEPNEIDIRDETGRLRRGFLFKSEWPPSSDRDQPILKAA